MAKKVVKKKLKIKAFLFLLLLIAVISLCGYFLFTFKLKNIVINGNVNLKDDYIIELAGIKDYPKLINISSSKIENILDRDIYIESSKVKKSIFGKITISIDENLPIYTYSIDNSVYLEDGNTVTIDKYNDIFIPRLINATPIEKRELLLKEIQDIDLSVINEISDMEYVPNEFDSERFLLYMDDATLVYTTLTKFDTLNNYFDYLMQLENKKGILYLDSGNYFEIRE